MERSQISQLIQMRSIGISDTTSVDSPCRPSSARPWSNEPVGSAIKCFLVREALIVFGRLVTHLRDQPTRQQMTFGLQRNPIWNSEASFSHTRTSSCRCPQSVPTGKVEREEDEGGAKRDLLADTLRPSVRRARLDA
jgi:hypothetical protein